MYHMPTDPNEAEDYLRRGIFAPVFNTIDDAEWTYNATSSSGFMKKIDSADYKKPDIPGMPGNLDEFTGD